VSRVVTVGFVTSGVASIATRAIFVVVTATVMQTATGVVVTSVVSPMATGQILTASRCVVVRRVVTVDDRWTTRAATVQGVAAMSCVSMTLMWTVTQCAVVTAITTWLILTADQRVAVMRVVAVDDRQPTGVTTVRRAVVTVVVMKTVTDVIVTSTVTRTGA